MAADAKRLAPPEKPRTETVLTLAAAAVCDPRTARKWLSGAHVGRLTAERLARAAKELDIKRGAT